MFAYQITPRLTQDVMDALQRVTLRSAQLVRLYGTVGAHARYTKGCIIFKELFVGSFSVPSVINSTVSNSVWLLNCLLKKSYGQ